MNCTEIAPDFRLSDEVWERVKVAIPPKHPSQKYDYDEVRKIVAAWGMWGTSHRETQVNG